MVKIKEYLLFVGSTLGAIITIFNFFNTVSPMINFFIIHWIIGPIMLYILSLVFTLMYFKYIINRKLRMAWFSDSVNIQKKYKLYRNILIILLTLFTISAIIYAYLDIYYLGKGTPVINDVFQ